MDEKTLESLTERFRGVVGEELEKNFDGYMDEKLKEHVGAQVSAETKKVVKELRAERLIYGKDRTGLDTQQKESFIESVKATVGMRHKADALIESEDNRGGFLVPDEVDDSIRRIAASVGLVMNQAEPFNMSSDQVRVPSYRGSFLEGAYVDEDSEGDTTAITFSQARLIAKTWQLAFPLSNELLADSAVDLADWLLTLAGEAMANMVDKQGFAGTGSPFVGILNDGDVSVTTISSGTTFASFDPLVDGSDIPAQLDKSVRRGAAWYMEDTVWAKIRQKTSSNSPLLGYAGAVTDSVLRNNPAAQTLQPDGELMGFPVFTTKHLPSNANTAANTKYIIFGNMQSFAFGRRENLSVSQHTSGTFDGKEVSLANQVGIIYRNRHALVNTLPGAFVVVKTNSS